MKLEEALRLYPEGGHLLNPIIVPDSMMREAGQVIADSFRRLFTEQINVIHGMGMIKAGSLRGSQYSLVRTIDLDNAAELLRKLYKIGY